MLCFVLLVFFLIPILVQAQSLEDIITQQESKGVHWSISVINEQGQSLESWNNQKKIHRKLLRKVYILLSLI